MVRVGTAGAAARHRQPGGRELAVALAQPASRGDPVRTSSGNSTVTVSRVTPALSSSSATSVTKLPARADSVSQPRISSSTVTSADPLAGRVKVSWPSAPTTRWYSNSRGWGSGSRSPVTVTGSQPSLSTVNV